MTRQGWALVLAGALGVTAAAQQVPASAVRGLHWRSIGPAATGGRIADVTGVVQPGEPETMYVATATGGAFRSDNAGVSWTPIFDHAGGMTSIGAIAVAPSNPSVVWIGTGEVDNRQSSSWGDGIYKSEDAGRTWRKMGLADTRHIGKIVIDPHNPDVVYVAALGHLWGSNTERGVYKTTDGGATWRRVLYVNQYTGATDLAMSPNDPNLVFAAMYQRERKGWGYNGGGPGSGIYRTSDGGAHWTQLRQGLPRGVKGRIGLAIYPRDPRIVYAIVEADPQPAFGGFGGRGGRGPGPPKKGGIFRSQDGGQHWQHMSGLDPRPSYYSRIYVDPRDPRRVYIMGSERGFYISNDAGRTFRDVFSRVHGEDHAMWINPSDPEQLLIGGDGGVSISYDKGKTWLFRDNLPIGQFYNISVSTGSPYLICGGLQDNGNWCTPSATNLSYGISNHDAFNVGGGDGMQAVFDGNNQTLLVSLQNGNTARVKIPELQRQTIGPALPEQQPARVGFGATGGYRWYWTAPLIVSHFNPQVVYTGANVLFRSTDEGRSWTKISPDLTAHIDRSKLTMMGAPIPKNALSKNDGQDNFSALTAIAESPLDAKVLYTGADDGTLEGTRDGGAHWTKLNQNVPGLPAMANVSGIEASRFAKGRVYATFDNHFNDDYHPYVYVSQDYGQTWKKITSGLPETAVHRIRENPRDANFLVAGLEEGVYASWDGGAHWTSLTTNFPPVPVYDLVWARGGRSLVLGTHGRGIWILDHTAPLLGLGAEAGTAAAHLFAIPATHRTTIYRPQAWFGWGEFFAPNPPQGAVVTYYLPEAAKGGAKLAIEDASGRVIRTLDGPARAGLNTAVWDLHYRAAVPGRPGFGGRGGASGPWVEPGSYRVSVSVAGDAPLTGTVMVGRDPDSPLQAGQERARAAEVMAAYQLQLALAPAQKAAQTAERQLAAMRRFAQAVGSDGAAGEAAKTVAAASQALQKPAAAVARALAVAGAAERGMDGYEGMPTADQVRELGWAKADATAAVASLNQFLNREMPKAYAAMGRKMPWPAIAPVKLATGTR
jgi:photosystem II stability/assembly factor-like uncharacterized protein